MRGLVRRLGLGLGERVRCNSCPLIYRSKSARTFYVKKKCIYGQERRPAKCSQNQWNVGICNVRSDRITEENLPAKYLQGTHEVVLRKDRHEPCPFVSHLWEIS